jgi:hypothetical protein
VGVRGVFLWVPSIWGIRVEVKTLDNPEISGKVTVRRTP